MESAEQNVAWWAGEPTVSAVDGEAAVARPIGAPLARPIGAPLVRPVVPRCTYGPAPDRNLPVPGRTDTLAIASAVCGFTAIVPVVSQVMGLALGIASLRRIRGARRSGSHLRGRGWALAGIFSSGFVLLSWVVIFAVLIAVGRSLTHTADVLGSLPSAG